MLGRPRLGQTAVGYPMIAETLTNNGASDHLPIMVHEDPPRPAPNALAPPTYNSSTMVIGGNAAIGSNSSSGSGLRQGSYEFCIGIQP